MFFYDLHCHTSQGSADAPGRLKSIVRMAKRRGLDGIAVTDHNKVYKGPMHMEGVDIIPGVEVTVDEGQHLLGYFVEGEVERGRSFKETVSDIHRKGGYAVWAHPLRKRDLFEQKGEEILSLIDGIESGNAMTDEMDRRKLSYVGERYGLLQTAGSDAHTEGQIGMAVIATTERISRDNFTEVIKKGSIVVREEVKGFKEKNDKWREVMKKCKPFLGATRSHFLKMVFHRVVVRNYLRISNIGLKRINFNHKEDFNGT